LNTSPSSESVFLSLNWAKYLHSGEWYSLITKATSVLKKETRLSASHQVEGGLNQTNVYETGRAFSTMALQCANMCMLHSVLTMSNKHVLAGTASTERNGTPDYKQHESLRNRWRDVKKDVIQPMLKNVENEQTAICDRLLGGDLGGQSEGPISAHVHTFLHASIQVVSLTVLCTMAESENMKAHFEDAPHSFERSSSQDKDKHSQPQLVQDTRPLLKHLIEFLFEWDHMFSLFHQLHWQDEGNHHAKGGYGGDNSVPGSSASPQRSAEDAPLVGFNFQILCTPDSFALHDTWNEGDSLATTTKDFSVCTFSAGKYTDGTKPVWSERFGVQYRSYELQLKDDETSSDDARLMSTEGSSEDIAVVAKMKALRIVVDAEHHVFAQLFEVMLSLLDESSTLSNGEERMGSRTSVSKLFHKGKQRPSELSAMSAEKDSQLYRYQRAFFEIILDELIRKMQQTAANSKRKASVKTTAHTSTVRESGQSSATTASSNGSGDGRRDSVTSHDFSPEKKRTTGDEHRKGKLQLASVSALNLHAIKFVSQAIEYCAKAGAASVIRNRKFLEVLLRTSKTFFFALDGAFWDPRQRYGTMSRWVTEKEFSITTTATSGMSLAEDTLKIEQENQYTHQDERLQDTPASTLPALSSFPLHHRDVKNGGFIHSCLTMRSIVLELARLLVRSNVTIAKSASSPMEAPTDLASSLGMSARALLPSLDGKRNSTGSSNVEASKKPGDSSSNSSENVRYLISAEIPDSFMEARILLRTLQDTCLTDPFAIIQILNCLEKMVEDWQDAHRNEPQVFDLCTHHVSKADFLSSCFKGRFSSYDLSNEHFPTDRDYFRTGYMGTCWYVSETETTPDPTFLLDEKLS
jgi:hypothetical protein